MANPFVHVELQTRDLAKRSSSTAASSSSRMWRCRGGSYTLIDVGDGTGGFQNTDPNVPPFWLAYVGVDDIAASTARAKALGATIVVDVMQVGNIGKLSVVRDPAGATLTPWQGLPHD